MKKINIELTIEEAIILFEFITKFNEKKYNFKDQSEQRVLWDLECILEKQVDYSFEDLEKAREKIRDNL